jgi:hypothetical protein
MAAYLKSNRHAIAAFSPWRQTGSSIPLARQVFYRELTIG